MTPQREDATRLQEILSELYGARIGRDEARSAVIDVVLARLHCARVSLWKFVGSGAELSLLCFAARRAGGAFDPTEQRLCLPEYRDYFNALIERGTFMSVDALADPALQPMRDSYLRAHGIGSILDAAFLLNGRAYGMICCEEATPRNWSPADVVALRAIVTKLALLMSRAPESALWQTASLPLQELPPCAQPALQ